MNTQVYLLAAGRGRRMGGPKAWMEHEGRPLLARHMDFLLAVCPPDKIAVSIQEEWLERCRALHPEALWVPVDPDAAPLASLQALLKRSPLESWGFVFHVDMPLWDKELFDALAAAAREAEAGGDLAVIPRREGRRGHPVLLSPKAQTPILALDPGRDRLDLWLSANPVRYAEVSSPRSGENWNTPKDTAS